MIAWHLIATPSHSLSAQLSDSIGSGTLITERIDESHMLHTSVCPHLSLYTGLYLRQTIDLPGGDGVALLTAGRVLTFGTKRLRLKWDLPLTQVQRVINEDKGIQFAHKVDREHDKYLVIEGKRSQTWFYEQIVGVVKSFNARRRMDL
jgi:hypothetical protein